MQEILRIDTREKPLEYIEIIRGIVGSVEIVTLPAADYAVRDLVGVERKKTPNLVSSLVKDLPNGNKELFDQLDRCLGMYQTVILLVEGSLTTGASPRECMTEGRVRKVPYMAVQAALLKVQEKGVRLVHTENIYDTALFLKWVVSRDWRRNVH